MVVYLEEDELMHYGILRRSGRYPWGSGGDYYVEGKTFTERSQSLLDLIKALIAKGFSRGEIAAGFGMRTADLTALQSIATNQVKAATISQVQGMKARGMSNTAIGERLGIPESTVRSYLQPGAELKRASIFNTADALRREVDSKGLIDVGRGVENYLGVSKERKDAALALLREEGYNVYYMKIRTAIGNETSQVVLAPPGVSYSDAYKRRGEIKGPTEVSDDFGETWFGMKPPKAVSPKRVQIIYSEDGGSNYDGVIYLRPGVKDLDMGGKQYAQVRIQVGPGHYIKGMAVYKPDLPDGVDIAFNTNKSKKDAPKLTDVLKELNRDKETGKVDLANPFGAVIKNQIQDENGNVTSALNIVNDDASWAKWSNTIASQVLSKQSPTLAKQQLNMTMERRLAQYDEIMALTNPTVKRRLLEDFAESTDAAAVHLKAAALPGQRWHVILPIDSLSDNEIYAPNYKDGTRVALIRYPHGGTFEIPELTVNNRHRDARSIIGTDARNAVGINARVAERLSGADFDGDTVLVIPNDRRQIRATPALRELDGFAPREQYREYPGMKVISPQRMQQEMGDISNLITDMTIRGAPQSDIARAVRHSMVVIDAHKHKLNYRQSAIDNGILALKKKYQQEPAGTMGASTLISRARATEDVPVRIARRARDGGPFDPVTGRKQFTETGETYVDAQGVTRTRMMKVTRLSNTEDAHTLSTGTPMETIYADHSNRLKTLANQARVELARTPRAERSPSARATYKNEVASLRDKLDLAQRSAPLERQAQTLAAAILRQKKAENPAMDPETEKKIKFQALEVTRARVGAKKNQIQFSPSEWDAIQAGAISDSMLSQILDHADMTQVKELATPRNRLLMTPARMKRAESMLSLGYTRAEVAAQLGVSLSTLDESMSS